MSGTRSVSKLDMLYNDLSPDITVNAQTFEVFVDGRLIHSDPVESLPLTQKYMLR